MGSTSSELTMFQDAFRRFCAGEIVPHYEVWEQEGMVSREVWRKAGELGYLCLDVPEEYGGAGVSDFRYSAAIAAELSRIGAPGVGFAIHSDMVVPYITEHGSHGQKERWLPGLVRGELIGAIAMTEPATGSDLAAIQTTATPEGDHFVLSGQKTFISNGILNDLVIVVARTKSAAGPRGISLLVVERGMPGYERGKRLEKIGLHAQDTAELFFHEVRVPAENLLGELNAGFLYLMQNLPRERLTIAAGAVAAAEAAIEWTVAYCKERTAFGQTISSFQNTQFRLAEMATEAEIGRSFIERCMDELTAGTLTAEKAAMAKWWCTDMQVRVVDGCLQMFGGYGYMREYPIARAYLDARAQKIYGGSNEIMKRIISRSMGL
jgi:long-chain-acyl-CoA dehydrogenase